MGGYVGGPATHSRFPGGPPTFTGTRSDWGFQRSRVRNGSTYGLVPSASLVGVTRRPDPRRRWGRVDGSGSRGPRTRGQSRGSGSGTSGRKWVSRTSHPGRVGGRGRVDGSGSQGPRTRGQSRGSGVGDEWTAVGLEDLEDSRPRRVGGRGREVRHWLGTCDLRDTLPPSRTGRSVPGPPWRTTHRSTTSTTRGGVLDWCGRPRRRGRAVGCRL